MTSESKIRREQKYSRKNEKFHKSTLAEHIWNNKGEHFPLWNEIKFRDIERYWKQRKLK